MRLRFEILFFGNNGRQCLRDRLRAVTFNKCANHTYAAAADNQNAEQGWLLVLLLRFTHGWFPHLAHRQNNL